MTGRTIAIGDIHGCSEALHVLLDVINPQMDDQVITLGDCVDRGTNTRSVIEELMELGKRCNFVQIGGNHEVMMLTALKSLDESHLDFWLQHGGKETVDSYGGTIENISEAHIDFLSRSLRYYENDDHIFVHASYIPDEQMKNQTDAIILWQHLDPTTVPRPHISGKRVIVGHTPQLTGEILDLKHVVCIDTFCFGSGWLSALDTTSGELWQVDKQGKIHLDNQWEDLA